MRKTFATAVAVLISMAVFAPAEARRHSARAEVSDDDARPARRSHEARNFWENEDEGSARSSRRARRHRDVSNDDNSSERHSRRRSRSLGEGGHSAGARPSAWCGWYMRTQKGGGPELNLAANWRRWGSHASGPQVGAVVVWPHHVGEITGKSSNGQWIVKSGNDGGQVKERARSVSGAVFRVG
jgi:hypothetical protein